MLVYVRVSERQLNCHYALLIKLCLPVSVVVITTLLWFVVETCFAGPFICLPPHLIHPSICNDLFRKLAFPTQLWASFVTYVTPIEEAAKV